MRFLNISRFTDPTPLRLLDYAYMVVLLPLLLLIKVPMLLYLLLVFVLLLLHKNPTNLTLFFTAILGLLALFLSLYGAFNFSGLSRLRIFIELLVYLLLIAVSLQRMTGQINFYLLISPVLLLALSLFFFNSIVMLVYVVIEIFFLLLLILSYRMQGSLRENLRMTGMLFALSLPWVMLLFVFFPRISFEHASYGFHGDDVSRTGHDGMMYLDNKALLVPSDRIVMEVGFEDLVPTSEQLYFRGTVLYSEEKNHWKPLPKAIKRGAREPLERMDDLIVYKVSLYPTKKRWLYLLDMPVEAPSGATVDADFVTTLKEPIQDPQHYEASSALGYSYGKYVEPAIIKASLSYHRDDNPQSLKLGKRLQEKYPDSKLRATALVNIFKDQNLTYSLRPKPIDLNHSVDSFLFEKRSGYCVHFASSFVLLARMAGIPARIVTGYKADPINSIKNYLIIKERDAHAWAELLIDRRWIRYETTATASMIDTKTVELLGQEQNSQEGDKFFTQTHLYLMYLKYQVETWILEYSYFRQMQLLDRARGEPGFVLKLLSSFGLFVLLSFALFFYFRRPVCQDKLLCTISPLLKVLQKEGYRRKDGETMHHFFQRYISDHPERKSLKEIDRLYELIRYGDDDSTETQKELQRVIRAFESGVSQ
ncbi:MAG: DUF3488 and transglutaminase-like domain-containing protein [Campylobacterota bacterium]|nr:DUF3488 and transglutaminase-like domain-containing protein [Campylobacterota bacterium]